MRNPAFRRRDSSPFLYVGTGCLPAPLFDGPGSPGPYLSLFIPGLFQALRPLYSRYCPTFPQSFSPILWRNVENLLRENSLSRAGTITEL